MQDCIVTEDTDDSSVAITDCGDFEEGNNSAWAHILTATTAADGASSQEAQTFTMNVTSLPEGGANVRVYKTTANGSDFFGNAVALTLGSNSIQYQLLVLIEQLSSNSQAGMLNLVL